MSNNYELLDHPRLKYIYNNVELANKIYIFELELIDVDNSKYFIRKLIKNSQGMLISDIDNILYEPIKRYNLTVIDINNLNNIYSANGEITSSIIKCNNIYINFMKTNNLIKCTYNIF